MIDRQLDALHTTQKYSGRLVGVFQQRIDGILEKSLTIQKDVCPWETALKNIRKTHAELDTANDAYYLPAIVEDVVRHGNRNPHAMSEALQYLVSAKEYLSDHPSNPTGEQMSEKVETYTEKAIGIAEAEVLACVMRAMSDSEKGRVAAPSQKAPPKNSTGAIVNDWMGGMVTPRRQVIDGSAAPIEWKPSSLINRPEALKGVDEVISTLHKVFDRRQVAQEIKAAVISRIGTILRECSEHYDTEIAIGPTTYRRGSQPLIKVNRAARSLVLEAQLPVRHDHHPTDGRRFRGCCHFRGSDEGGSGPAGLSGGEAYRQQER